MEIRERRLWQLTVVTLIVGLGISLAMAQRRARTPVRRAGPASEQALKKQLRQLEVRLAKVEQGAFKKTGSTWALDLNGARISVGGSGDVEIKGREVDIRANRQARMRGNALMLQGNTSAEVKTNTVLKLNGSLIKLNNGRWPASRHGDRAVGGTPAIVQGGAQTVLMP